MKYLRKIAVLMITVIFLVSIIIGMGIIFTVKNVNVSIDSYAYSAWDEMNEGEQAAAAAEIDGFEKIVLKKCRVTLMPLISDDELKSCFEDTNYVFVSCEKQYPCTLNIVIKERREVFITSMDEGVYDTYDDMGVRMRTGITIDEAMNNLDLAPNVYLYGVQGAGDVVEVARVSRIFADKFLSLRSIVKEIRLQKTDRYIDFVFRCGITVHIADYANLTETKLEKAYEKFVSLKGEEKLSGRIIVNVVSADGTVNAERVPDIDF